MRFNSSKMSELSEGTLDSVLDTLMSLKAVRIVSPPVTGPSYLPPLVEIY